MRLPQLPYNKQHTQRQILNFGGLNLTDTAAEGELIETENLSALRYPRLSARRGRQRLTGDVEKATAVYEWDGKLVYVADGVLYYDGEAKGNVADGEKQFAVVNTKLIVWPDKVYIDLKNKSFNRLDSKTETSTEASVSVTADTLTAEVLHKFATDAPGAHFLDDPHFGFNPACYCYGRNITAVENCFSGGEWNNAALEALTGYGLYGFISGEDEGLAGSVDEGLIFIPRKTGDSFNYVFANYADGGQLPDKTKQNAEGYYGVFTYADPDYFSEYLVNLCWHFDVYKVGATNVLFSVSFSAGDIVDIRNTLYKLCDAEFKRIESIDDSTNTITFDEEFFDPPNRCHELGSDEAITAGTQKALKVSSNNVETHYKFTPTVDLPLGTALVLYLRQGANKIKAVVPDTGVIIETYNTSPDEPPEDPPETYTAYSTQEYTLNTTAIAISRVVPDLDYICEHDNRLFGVSNNVENEIYNASTKQIEKFTSRCIYVSALGLPERFWDFEGLDTDSYQVAVGSEGDFTAVCDFENACIFWKENEIYKLYGSYPSEYYLSEEAIPGVQAGAYKSLVQANGRLIYKAPHGVYTYGGNSSSLISDKLGDMLNYKNAAAGYDGQQYYLSADVGAGSVLLSYDTRTGIWLQVSEERALDFCTYDEKFVMLKKINSDGGRLYHVDTTSTTDDGTSVSWRAVFAPFAERDAHERKHYLRLLLRVEIGTGGSCTVYSKRSDAWHEERSLTTAGEYTVVIPISPNRLDNMEVKISGTGPCALLSFAREFKTGSVYGGEFK